MCINIQRDALRDLIFLFAACINTLPGTVGVTCHAVYHRRLLCGADDAKFIGE